MEINLISIVVPVYNLEKEIERCILSIVNQTYANLEIIIVDDGSTDASKEVIQKIARTDSRIRTIFKTNGGVSSARIAGIEASKGSWIGFVDGDDQIESDMYERLLANAVRNNADISHCGYQMLFDDGRINYFYNSGELLLFSHTEGIKELLSGKRIEPGLCNKLYKADIVKQAIKNSMFDISIRINEDLLLNYILFNSVEKSIYEDFCPYHYIVRNESATRKRLNDNRIWDPIRVKSIILKNSSPELKNEARCNFIGTCISSYNMIALDGIQHHKKDAKKIRKILSAKKSYIVLINKKHKFIIWMILHFGIAYQWIYRFYSKRLAVNKYI